MNHRGHGVVKDGQHRRAGILEPCEVLVVGRHGRGLELGDGIRQTHVRGVLHQLALLHLTGSVLLVGQRADEDGIVDHRREQQFSFLLVGELFVAADAKLVVSPCKEPCKGFIVGREDGLTTSLAQHVRVPQVVNQPAIGAEGTLEFLGLL